MNFKALLGIVGAMAFVVVVAGTILSGVQAGSQQVTAPIVYSPEVVVAFAKKIERTLIARDVQVALVARTGRLREDLPDGIAYTHSAFWVYSEAGTREGRFSPGYAVYNLYQGDGNETNVSSLVRDYPSDFVAGMAILDAGVIIPTPDMQKKLLKLIKSPTYEKLHNPSYSLVSNPFNRQFQNCTEFMLDVVMSATLGSSAVDDIKIAERNEFSPQTVDMGFWLNTLAPLLIQDISGADHDGPIRTATFVGLGDYMADKGLAQDRFAVTGEDVLATTP